MILYHLRHFVLLRGESWGPATLKGRWHTRHEYQELRVTGGHLREEPKMQREER